MSTIGYSSFEPGPSDLTVMRSTRPLIAPRASCIVGNSAIWPISRSSRNVTLALREEPVDHPLHVESLDVLVRLPEVHEDDGLADRPRHRERRAAFRVRVELRQDDAVQADGLVELLRLLDRVVACEGVPDVQDQVRVRHPLDLLHLVHQVLVRLHAARRVDEDDVLRARPRVLDRVERDGRGVGAGLVLDELEADRLGVLLELLDRPRAERVRGSHDAGVALLLDVVRELGDRRRLPRAVHPDEHDDERPWASLDEAEEVDRRDAQHVREGVAQRGPHGVREGRVPRDPLARQVVGEAVHDLLGHGERHVRFQEGDLQVVEDLFEFLLVDLAAGVADCGGRGLGVRLLLHAREPLPEPLEHLAPLARPGLPLQALVQVLHRLALGLRAPLQLREALADRVRRVRDRPDAPVEPLDLRRDVVVDHEVRADRDERLRDVPRLGDEERVRADGHEHLRALARVLVAGEGLPRAHVLLERDSDDRLLLAERLDLLAELVEHRHPTTQVRLGAAHGPPSTAYRTAGSVSPSAGTSSTVWIAMYFRGTPCWLPRTDRSFSRAAASSAAAISFAYACHARPMRKRPLIRNAFMERRGKGPGYFKTWGGKRRRSRLPEAAGRGRRFSGLARNGCKPTCPLLVGRGSARRNTSTRRFGRREIPRGIRRRIRRTWPHPPPSTPWSPRQRPRRGRGQAPPFRESGIPCSRTVASARTDGASSARLPKRSTGRAPSRGTHRKRFGRDLAWTTARARSGRTGRRRGAAPRPRNIPDCEVRKSAGRTGFLGVAPTKAGGPLAPPSADPASPSGPFRDRVCGVPRAVRSFRRARLLPRRATHRSGPACPPGGDRSGCLARGPSSG